MTRLRSAAFASIAACLVAAPAQAQVTPEQVWAFWQGMAQGAGYSMTAEAQRREGDRLVLDNVVTAMLTDTAAMRAPIGQVVMRDRGDGSVEVTLPPAFEMTMTVTEPERDPVQMVVGVKMENHLTVVSGTPEAPRYAVSADAVAVALSGPEVNGAALPMDMQVVLTGIKGTSALTPGASIKVVYDATIGAVELAVSADKPEGNGTFDLSMGVSDVATRFDGTLPADAAPNAELPAMLAAGLRGTGGYSTGAIEFGFDLSEDGKDTSVEGSAEASRIAFGLDPAGLSYQTSVSGVAVSASGGNIPFPQLDIALGEYALGLTLPLVKSDTPSDFAVLMRLVDLVLPEDVWAMVDSAASLPRDPATLVVDLKGKARLFEDLTSTSAAAAQPGTPPGEVQALTIDALQVKVAGADLTGTGAFTFDNADMTTFPGMPRPTGSADLKLVGGNTLLDKLVALGLVPGDQVMGLRMMMALFARPGDGPDTLTSKIEITPEAQILANGQRIQ